MLVYCLRFFDVLFCVERVSWLACCAQFVARYHLACSSKVLLALREWAQMNKNVLGWLQAPECSFNTECETISNDP